MRVQEQAVVVLHITLDNLYEFKDFSVDFSYPKKLVNSPLPGEHLPGRPSFRYKTVNIIIGANASGKTTLGKAIVGIFTFIQEKETTALTKSIKDISRSASFSIDFVAGSDILWRVEATIAPRDESGQYKADDCIVSVSSTPIRARDTYQTCKKRLDAMQPASGSFLESFDAINPIEWYTACSDPSTELTETPASFAKILDLLLRTLDPSIERVFKSQELRNTYIIKHPAGNVIIQNDLLLDSSSKLSRGTLSGIEAARFLSAVIQGKERLYYCDEILACLHSDVEQYLLATMIDQLGPYEQLFFTTHNTEILKLNLPHHSFLFLRKERGSITATWASEYLKRNTDNRYNAVENDRFLSKPDLSLLDGIL